MNGESETMDLGLVVLSSSLKLLYMNRQATALLTRIEPTGQLGETQQALITPLYHPCQEIVDTIQHRLASNHVEHFFQYRTISNSSDTILLKAFGLPDRRGLSHSRIVLLLSPSVSAVTPQTDNMQSSKSISQATQVSANLPAAIGM